MRLTIEFYGHTFRVALERDEEPAHEPNLTPSDLSSDTQRAEAFNFDRSLIGFMTSKGKR